MATYESRIPQIIAELEKELDKCVERAGFSYEKEAKARARYDTGNMRRLIRWEKSGLLEGEVTAGAAYTIFNEYGTIYMSAQPMFGPASELVMPQFEEDCRLTLKRVVE